MELGNMIDLLYSLRQLRLDKTREVDKLKEEETLARLQIMEHLDSAGLAKASGGMATCGIISKIEPQVTDWEAIHEYIRIQNRFDLVQKRLSAPAWRDLKESGVLLPGTEAITVRDLSLTKSSRG